MSIEQLPDCSPGPAFSLCEDICLPEGKLISVYVGVSGVFALAEDSVQPDSVYFALRELLETARIRVYLFGTGYYEPGRGIIRTEWDEDELSDQITNWILSDPPRWTADRVHTLVQRLQRKSSHTLGHFIDTEGNRHFVKNGTFRPASFRSSEVMFYATLLGGTLGIHRFYSGKFFTGLLYFLTGGLMGIGWLVDLLSLFLTAQKDCDKKYFAPLKNPAAKLLMLPVGFFVTLLCLGFQVKVLSSFTSLLSLASTSAFRQISPANARQIEFMFERFIDSLSSSSPE